MRTLKILSSMVHILIAGFQMTFIYTPLHDIPGMFTVVQWVSTPLLVISGVLLVLIKCKARRLSVMGDA